MIKEVCIENLTLQKKMMIMGADRFELCDNLAVGGTTVSLGVLKQSLNMAHSKKIPIFPIIRPRGGNFEFSQAEKQAMLTDICAFVSLGVDGIVVGGLKDSNIDYDFIADVIKQLDYQSITFHMAFDEIPREKQFEAIDYLYKMGISRILTHGNKVNNNIMDNIDWLIKLQEYSTNRITIVPGGGITKKVANEIEKLFPFFEMHGTHILL